MAQWENARLEAESTRFGQNTANRNSDAKTTDEILDFKA